MALFCRRRLTTALHGHHLILISRWLFCRYRELTGFPLQRHCHVTFWRRRPRRTRRRRSLRWPRRRRSLRWPRRRRSFHFIGVLSPHLPSFPTLVVVVGVGHMIGDLLLFEGFRRVFPLAVPTSTAFQLLAPLQALFSVFSATFAAGGKKERAKIALTF